MLSAFSQAWASWKTAPGVALLAVVAFAVGIGSATAIFTVINGVLLRPLPYPSSERFVLLYGSNTSAPGAVHGDVGSRAAGLPAADHELRRVRLVRRRPIPSDGAWRAAIHPRHGSDACAGAAARFTAPRPVVCRRQQRRHLERALAAPWRRARHHRQRHHARRAPLYRERRHATGVPVADRELPQPRRHRRVDSVRCDAGRP